LRLGAKLVDATGKPCFHLASGKVGRFPLSLDIAPDKAYECVFL
jgi:hypothetical protein